MNVYSVNFTRSLERKHLAILFFNRSLFHEGFHAFRSFPYNPKLKTMINHINLILSKTQS